MTSPTQSAALDPMVDDFIDVMRHPPEGSGYMGPTNNDLDDWKSEYLDLARQLTERLQVAVPADHVVVSRDTLTKAKEWGLRIPSSGWNNDDQAVMDLLDAALAVDQVDASDDAKK